MAVNVTPRRSIGFCFVVVCLLVSSAEAENLLCNPGFETPETSDWTCSGGLLSVVPDAAHSGQYGGLVSERTQTEHGLVQSVLGLLESGATYRISAWVKLQNSDSNQVSIVIRQRDANGDESHRVVQGTAWRDRWSYLVGYFTPNIQEGRIGLTCMDLCVEGPSVEVNFYVDDVRLEEVGDWYDVVQEQIEQYRMRQAVLTVFDANDQPIDGAEVAVRQIRHHFAFGSAINTNVLTTGRINKYGDFFRDHFEWAVMENESKWYSNEPSRGYVTYNSADRIYDWCQSNGITMRGHCLYWASESMVQSWLKNLNTTDLRAAIESRMESAMTHYKGKFVHWDINNEMVQNHYFEDRLGEEIRVWMFQRAHEIDPNCLLFVNEYNIISGGWSLNGYLDLVNWLRDKGAPVQAAGVQCHMGSGFDRWDTIERFDKVASLGLPIWCTEFDVADSNEYDRADELEAFYRIAFSHPSVEGILMWGFWQNSHWRDDCYIVNSDWTLNEAGRRYEALMDEWTTNTEGLTDPNGVMSFNGFHGIYEIEVSLPDGATATTTLDLPVGQNPLGYALVFDESGAITVNPAD